MSDKKGCLMAIGLMVFRECAMCRSSEDEHAKECANSAAAAIAGEYDRANTRKGKERKRQ